MAHIIRFTNRCTEQKEQNRITCGCCGREIPAYPSRNARDYLEITKKWGYFSKKDGETHHFYLCEDCYDRWLETFAGPVEISEDTELL